MSPRSFGHVADRDEHVAEDLRNRHVGALLGPHAAGIPTAVDYSSLLDHIPDQGPSNSCVGQAFATAIYLRAHLDGIPLPRPSAKAIYDLARLTDSPRALIDDGCRPRAAVDGMTGYGLVAESRWPLTATNVNTPPPLDVFRAGIGARLSGYYRIGDGDVASMVRQALAQRFVPVFAMDVDASYEGLYGPALYNGPSGPALGSHMQAVVGFGPGYFLIANSWGESWGLGGLTQIADSFFNTPAVRDVLVPTIMPRAIT